MPALSLALCRDQQHEIDQRCAEFTQAPESNRADRKAVALAGVLVQKQGQAQQDQAQTLGGKGIWASADDTGSAPG